MEKKEFTVIYFNEDGGANISYATLYEVNRLLDEVKDESEKPVTMFHTLSDGPVDTMERGEDVRYMIIKGLPITPRITQAVKKLEV